MADHGAWTDQPIGLLHLGNQNMSEAAENPARAARAGRGAKGLAFAAVAIGVQALWVVFLIWLAGNIVVAASSWFIVGWFME
jgi:hypothetical protein